MLILTRKNGQSIHIGDEITITVKEIRGNQIRLGIDAPGYVKVYREEIYAQIVEQNKFAASSNKSSVGVLASSLPSKKSSLSEGTIHFEDGLIGFDSLKDFQLVIAEGPFFWLELKEDPSSRFLVAPVSDLESLYSGKFDPKAEQIDFKSKDELGMFLIVTVEDEIEKSSVNAKAPILVNFRSQKAVQLIIDEPEFEMKKAISSFM